MMSRSISGCSNTWHAMLTAFAPKSTHSTLWYSSNTDAQTRTRTRTHWSLHAIMPTASLESARPIAAAPHCPRPCTRLSAAARRATDCLAYRHYRADQLYLVEGPPIVAGDFEVRRIFLRARRDDRPVVMVLDVRHLPCRSERRVASCRSEWRVASCRSGITLDRYVSITFSTAVGKRKQTRQKKRQHDGARSSHAKPAVPYIRNALATGQPHQSVSQCAPGASRVRAQRSSLRCRGRALVRAILRDEYREERVGRPRRNHFVERL